VQLESYLRQLKSNKFHLSSEAEEILDSLFFLQMKDKEDDIRKKQIKLRRKNILKFLIKNYDNIFDIFRNVKNDTSYIYKRTVLNMFFRILNEDYLKDIKMTFINDKVSYIFNLKILQESIMIAMNLLKSENSTIRFEACLLLSLF